MTHSIGIRHEDKYLMERRVALAPQHVEKLTKQGLSFIVERSAKRVFSDEEYAKAGAIIADKLQKANLIFGVKEIPPQHFEEGKTYVFFSHVVKGQPYNMPMLRQMMAKGCNLIDYEKIENEEGKRLIFFGRYAGLAGAINSLWALGQRLKKQGINNPFSTLKQAVHYPSLEEAKKEISAIGKKISTQGLPSALSPMVIAVTGTGNVAGGAHEILSLLPTMEISPKQLLDLKEEEIANNLIYKVVFTAADLSKPNDPNAKFDRADYYAHPENYHNAFEAYIPKISLLLNCMYWNERFPRIVTKDFLEKNYLQNEVKLKVIGDITCDPNGSIECTLKGTGIEDPVYVYRPDSRQLSMGFDGQGLLIMAVEILPSELPREASLGFGDALLPYVKAIATADYTLPFDQLELPNAIKKATILHNGKLTPGYEYIAKYL